MTDGRRLGIVPSILLVLAAFVVGQVPLLIATATTEHPDPPIIQDPIDPLIVQTWGRYDTWHYLDIARGGPTLYHCSPEYWPETEWCGNSGWLPLYPALIWATTEVTPLGLEQSGAVLARLAYLAELALIWFGVYGRRCSTATVLGLLGASVAAGVIWQVAIFPMSLTVLLVTASLVLLSRERWELAGLAAGLAATAHTMGVIAIGVGGLCVLLDLVRVGGAGAGTGAAPRPRVVIERATRFAIPALGCYLAMLGWYQWNVGEWSAPFMGQHKYGHSVQNPVAVLADRTRAIWESEAGTNRWNYVQTVLVAITAVAVSVRAALSWTSIERIERYLVVATLAFWIIPLCYGGALASYYRLETLTLPAMLLTPRLPRWMQAGLVAAFAVASYHVAQGFYIGILI